MHRCFILTGHAEEWNRHPRRHRWPLKLLKCDPATPAPSLFSWMEGGPNETKPQIQSKSRCCLSSIYRADSSINFDVTAYQHSAPPYDGCLFFHVWRHDLHVVPQKSLRISEILKREKDLELEWQSWSIHPRTILHTSKVCWCSDLGSGIRHPFVKLANKVGKH